MAVIHSLAFSSSDGSVGNVAPTPGALGWGRLMVVVLQVMLRGASTKIELKLEFGVEGNAVSFRVSFRVVRELVLFSVNF